jgi:hypothetical protein
MQPIKIKKTIKKIIKKIIKMIIKKIIKMIMKMTMKKLTMPQIKENQETQTHKQSSHHQRKGLL